MGGGGRGGRGGGLDLAIRRRILHLIVFMGYLNLNPGGWGGGGGGGGGWLELKW
jgi:hypothetical protein